uniref:Uncharacterized protein n=1 Tax=Arundo donax TaxID=35708 RepID=A0A0A9BXS4_ARUDO
MPAWWIFWREKGSSTRQRESLRQCHFSRGLQFGGR